MEAKDIMVEVRGIHEWSECELEEMYTAFENEEPYYTDVEMYEDAVTKAHNATHLAEILHAKYMFLRSEIEKITSELESEHGRNRKVN